MCLGEAAYESEWTCGRAATPALVRELQVRRGPDLAARFRGLFQFHRGYRYTFLALVKVHFASLWPAALLAVARRGLALALALSCATTLADLREISLVIIP